MSNEALSDAKKPILLIVLDGFGNSSETKYNAIANADAPTWQQLWTSRPHTLIHTSGMSVGLPEGQMGNSEVGHMTLGSGRVVYQNFTRISKAIDDGDFFTNPVYCEAVDKARQAGKAVHIIGLLSPGGVHSHQDHIKAALRLAAQRGVEKVYLHAILDGRDVPPRSAEQPLEEIEEVFEELGVGRVASICGRYFAMDRDKRWDRVQQAYDLLTLAKSDYQSSSALEGLRAAYERDENDEFVKATAITDASGNTAAIEDGDAVLCMNFRPDRSRQLCQALVDIDFDGFERRAQPKLAALVQTTEYSAELDAPVAFPTEDINNSFGEVMEKSNKKQLRIAETEKYAHVTFFFSGGREERFNGEDRILIPSPNVETYDQKPEMSAFELTEKLVEAIESKEYDAIICNYANCDMVGHTGDYDAAVRAVEALDTCLAKVVAAIEKVDGEMLITADHGNAELMFDEESGQKHTQHTTFPVPLVYVGSRQLSLSDDGSLADIVPTMLFLMGIEQPSEMSGHTLLHG